MKIKCVECATFQCNVSLCGSKILLSTSFFSDNDNVSKKLSDNDILLKNLVISGIPKPHLPPSVQSTSFRRAQKPRLE